MLTFLWISNVLSSEISLVNSIVSVLFAASIASSNESKYLLLILAAIALLAHIFIGLVITNKKNNIINNFLIIIPPFLSTKEYVHNVYLEFKL